MPKFTPEKEDQIRQVYEELKSYKLTAKKCHCDARVVKRIVSIGPDRPAEGGPTPGPSDDRKAEKPNSEETNIEVRAYELFRKHMPLEEVAMTLNRTWPSIKGYYSNYNAMVGREFLEKLFIEMDEDRWEVESLVELHKDIKTNSSNVVSHKELFTRFRNSDNAVAIQKEAENKTDIARRDLESIVSSTSKYKTEAETLRKTCDELSARKNWLAGALATLTLEKGKLEKDIINLESQREWLRKVTQSSKNENLGAPEKLQRYDAVLDTLTELILDEYVVGYIAEHSPDYRLPKGVTHKDYAGDVKNDIDSIARGSYAQDPNYNVKFVSSLRNLIVRASKMESSEQN